jgi:hypothetical protein
MTLQVNIFYFTVHYNKCQIYYFHSMESQVPATDIPLTNGVNYQITLDGENMRVALTQLLIEIQTFMLENKSDDTRGFEMLIQVRCLRLIFIILIATITLL